MSDAKISSKISNGALYLIMSLFALGQLFPLIWLVDFSLCQNKDLFGAYILRWPSPPQFMNYYKAWTQGMIPKFLFNSIVVTLATLAITTVLSLTLGYAFTRMQWKFRKTFLTIMLLGMMIPIHATLLPNFFTFQKLGLLDNYLGLIIPYSAFALPMGIFIMTGFMETIPRSLEESAVMDGCSVYGIIFRIIFPLTKPAIVTIVIMTFLNCWNEFIMAATYLSSNTCKTLPFSVMLFAGLYISNYSVQFAVMALSALPALVIYILLNEQITKGITVGAVKG